MDGVNEHTRTEERAELNERRFRALIENSTEAITLLDANGVIVYDSPASPGLLGYGPEEWIGKDVFELIHVDDLPRVRDQFRRLAATPTARFSDILRLRHKNGSWRWMEAVAANLLAEPSVQAVVVNYRDITERQQTEERVQRQIRHLASLHEIDLAIASSFDLRTSLGILLEKVILQLDVDAASVLLLDPYTNTLEYLAQRGFRRTTAIQAASIPLGENYAGRAALERKTIQAHGREVMRESARFEALWREEGFESYVVVPLIAKGHVKGVLEVFHRAAISASSDWMDFLSTLGGQAAIAIDNAQLFENLQRANLELTLAYDATIEGWSFALDLRDKETEGHTQRVTQMALRLAEVLGMSKSEIVHIRRGALLHDIGKMGVPDPILLNPGPLSDEELVVMRQHPAFAYNMLSRIAYLRPAIDIPYCHHEKWDGSGYPRGLKGDEIPLAARLFAVVDVWDALCSDRTYRQGWPKEKVLEYIKEQSGKQFDPQVVAAFLGMLQKGPSMGGEY
jgi:PAS domain S-box-containing protein/putative nucleotidyltransferase with HDIG domain